LCYFFFQAEDGIRDFHVTGVQTCALPISTRIVLEEYGLGERAEEINRRAARLAVDAARRWSTPEQPRFVLGAMGPTTKTLSLTRSEERRVGKEGRSQMLCSS